MQFSFTSIVAKYMNFSTYSEGPLDFVRLTPSAVAVYQSAVDVYQSAVDVYQFARNTNMHSSIDLGGGTHSDLH
jgi:hypothetical protein